MAVEIEIRPSRSATYVVAASNSPAPAKAQSDYVCDGTDDEIEINAAITASGLGGLVFLTQGTYYISSAILLNLNGTLLQGSGWDYNPTTGATSGTKIVASATMTNSILTSAFHIRIQDLLIDGNSKAGSLQITKGYGALSHVCSIGHTNNNVLGGANDHLITNRCFFIGKPIKFTAGVTTIEGNSYFNGDGKDKCLIVDGTVTSITGCAFESYTGSAIDVNLTTTGQSFTCHGCYFESSFAYTYLIDISSGAASVYATHIAGNYQAADALGTYSVGLNGVFDAIVKGNKFNYNVRLLGNVYSAEVGDNSDAGVLFNGLTFRRIEIQRVLGQLPGRAIFWGTAAPVAGTWNVGDTCYNTAPAAGGTQGWVCTTAGTPGTWKAMANLAV